MLANSQTVKIHDKDYRCDWELTEPIGTHLEQEYSYHVRLFCDKSEFRDYHFYIRRGELGGKLDKLSETRIPNSEFWHDDYARVARSVYSLIEGDKLEIMHASMNYPPILTWQVKDGQMVLLNT